MVCFFNVFSFFFAWNLIIWIPNQSIDVYVAGVFSDAGTGISVDGQAEFSNGIWQPFSISDQDISLLSSYGSIVYFSYTVDDEEYYPGTPIPLGGLDTANGNTDVFSYLPLIAQGSSRITSLYADAHFVYVGGEFQLSLADGTLVNNCIFPFFFLSLFI